MLSVAQALANNAGAAAVVVVSGAFDAALSVLAFSPDEQFARTRSTGTSAKGTVRGSACTALPVLRMSSSGLEKLERYRHVNWWGRAGGWRADTLPRAVGVARSKMSLLEQDPKSTR